MNALCIDRAGPSLSIQDKGRAGYLGFGLSRGGAADQLALFEGAALLGQSSDLAALEMGGFGGDFTALCEVRIALTGAPMRATVDGTPIQWNASHVIAKGARLSIGAAGVGTYGYLHLGGGIDAPLRLASRANHLATGIGQILASGQNLAAGNARTNAQINMLIDAEPRFSGGMVRMVPSLQTGFFSQDVIAKFQATEFQRDARGNRMGVRLNAEEGKFKSDAGLSVLSEIIVPGDIQITGDGTPFVLLTECQTTGGYPRIGSVIPSDLARVAQAQPGIPLRFQFVTLKEAVSTERRESARRAGLAKTIRPSVRDPRDITDLLGYQLISGMTAGNE